MRRSEFSSVNNSFLFVSWMRELGGHFGVEERVKDYGAGRRPGWGGMEGRSGCRCNDVEAPAQLPFGVSLSSTPVSIHCLHSQYQLKEFPG